MRGRLPYLVSMKQSVLSALQVILATIAFVMTGAASAEFQTREAALAALREYNQLIAAEPNFAMLYTLRGDAYYAPNDLHGATENYTSAIKLDDRQDKAYFWARYGAGPDGPGV